MNRIRAALSLIVLSASAAQAAVITPLTRAQFQTAVSSGTIGSQNFDGLANGTVLSTLNGVTYGASAGSPIVTSAFLTTTTPNGLGSTSIGYFLSSETGTFSFASSISAFAVDVNTFATTTGAYTATLNTGDVANSLPLIFPNRSTGEFIGFVTDAPFNSVSIRATTGFSYTLDTLVYGSAGAVTGGVPVPEPASLALLGAGLLGSILLWRKRA